YQYIGTGTVVDRMIDWFTPAGEPRPVTRARFDWQVYDPKRKEKGGVRWHTVEGPAVLKRKDFYYEMFSGGNWQNATYGVSFAVSDTILRDDEWLQFADGERVLPILRTIPGVVMGPGHNCVVRGPNNRELYCIYHRWAGDSRVMSIDRMDNAGHRLFVYGASHTPQQAPFTPTITEMFRSNVPPENGLDVEGEWSFGPSGAITGPLGRATIRPQAIPESFLCEISWACTDPINVPGDFGIRFLAGDTEAILSFSPGTNKAAFSLSEGGKQNTSVTYLPADLVWSAAHLFRIEADGRHINMRLDSLPTLLDITLTDNVKGFELFFNDLAATVKSFELTSGFEELFENDGELSDAWKIESGNPINIHGGELVAQRQDDFSLVRENLSFRDLEFAVNVRLLEPAGQVALILRSGISDLFRMTMDVDKRIVRVAKGSSYELPQDVDLFTYHQLKIVKMQGQAFYFFDDRRLGSANVSDSEVEPQFIAAGAAFAIEMIRLTAI
ncbi:MAG: hypothetical protein ACJ72Z_13165, partial [Pyrinomonadaceae bacterium]